MFELLHCVLHCVLHAILQLKALCDTRPLRSLVPARFICLSTMLKRKCREGLDTVTRKKPFRREARAFRFSSIADKAGTWHGHTETIRNQARSGVKDSKHIEKRWNTHIYIYILSFFFLRRQIRHIADPNLSSHVVPKWKLLLTGWSNLQGFSVTEIKPCNKHPVLDIIARTERLSKNVATLATLPRFWVAARRLRA